MVETYTLAKYISRAVDTEAESAAKYEIYGFKIQAASAEYVDPTTITTVSNPETDMAVSPGNFEHVVCKDVLFEHVLNAVEVSRRSAEQ